MKSLEQIKFNSKNNKMRGRNVLMQKLECFSPYAKPHFFCDRNGNKNDKANKMRQLKI